MIDKNRLLDKLGKYKILLSDEQLDKLAFYSCNLIEWNNKINLTAIVEPEDIENKHFIDSLLIASQPEIAGSVVDVGTGAGFPGIVMGIYNKNIELTLMEPTGKRVKFLQDTTSKLELSCNIVKERAEEAGRKKWRESFDISCARAVAALPVLCEYCLPLTKVGGLFIAMKGSGAEEEVKASESAIDKLGGKLELIKTFSLPNGEGRSLIYIKKQKPCTSVYPRNGGVISKRPL